VLATACTMKCICCAAYRRHCTTLVRVLYPCIAVAGIGQTCVASWSSSALLNALRERAQQCTTAVTVVLLSGLSAGAVNSAHMDGRHCCTHVLVRVAILCRSSTICERYCSSSYHAAARRSFVSLIYETLIVAASPIDVPASAVVV
jgi:hypothetical protein